MLPVQREKLKMKTKVTIPAFPRFDNVHSTKAGKNKKKTIYVFAFTCINIILRVHSYKVKKVVLHHTPRVITFYCAFDLYIYVHIYFAPGLEDRL